MGMNIARKRAAKANRRKAVVAEKRRLELVAGSLAERVRRAAGAPIRHCLITGPLFDVGIGLVVLARGATSEYLNVGVFMVDVYCRGVKDVAFRPFSAQELEAHFSLIVAEAMLTAVDPSHARKLLRELAAWAGSIGFAPHRDFAAVEPLFGDVSADACDATFQFGRDGKPLYIAGPSESPAEMIENLARVRAALPTKLAS